MAIEKCSNCGAQLDPSTVRGGVIECPFCHSKHIAARSQSDEALEFLKIGEHDLDTCRFADAYDAYAKAAQADAQEPQAYFGMALATHKIQYIKDYVNNKLQPICHEISDKVFSDDKNYKKACELATPEQKREYAAKAVEIDYIKKQFGALRAQKLEYDCFICVKVTDDNGGHTEDSHIASTLYHRLKEAGFKPFYSEEEMRGRTGADYEALILYALWESESMLVVCNDESYLNTPWVKNEYTRFIKMLRDDEKESDSITFVFGEKPVERLPGVNGKIQGVPFKSFDALDRIIKFVKNHEPVNRNVTAIERKKYGNKNYAPKAAVRQTIQKRVLESVEQREISVSDKSRLNIAAEFLSRGDFENAIRFGNELVKSNKANGAAYRILFLAKNGCKTEYDFVNKRQVSGDFSDFENAIAASDEYNRNKLYQTLYSHIENNDDYFAYKEYIELPDSKKTDIDRLNKNIFKRAIANKDVRMFDLAIKTVTDADLYIDMNLKFADALGGNDAIKYFKNVLAADPSHCRAQWCVFVYEVGAKNVIPYIANKSNQKTVEEKLFSYGFNKFAFDTIVDWAVDKCSDTSMTCAALDFAFTMVPQDEEEYYITHIELVTEKLLKKGKIDAANKYNEMLISIDPYAHKAYFDRCLIKRKMSNPLALVKYADKLLDDPDYMSAVSSYTEKYPDRKNFYLDVRDALIDLAADKDIMKNYAFLVKNKYVECEYLSTCKSSLSKSKSDSKNSSISELRQAASVRKDEVAIKGLRIGLYVGTAISLPFTVLFMLAVFNVSPFLEFFACILQFMDFSNELLIFLFVFLFPTIGGIVGIIVLLTAHKTIDMNIKMKIIFIAIIAVIILPPVITSGIGIDTYSSAKAEKNGLYIGDGYVLKLVARDNADELAVAVYDGNSNDVVIPETYGGKTVTAIICYDNDGDGKKTGALSGADMSNIYLPKTINYLGSGSLARCYNLVNIYYEGTKEEWSKITFYNGGSTYLSWDSYSGNYTVNCSDGIYSNS